MSYNKTVVNVWKDFKNVVRKIIIIINNKYFITYKNLTVNKRQ